jgi:hypothetical protein
MQEAAINIPISAPLLDPAGVTDLKHTKSGRYELNPGVSALIMLCVYSVTLLCGWAFFILFDEAIKNELLLTLVVDLLCSVIVFIFSAFLNNVSVFDPYPAVSTLAISWYWYSRWGAKNEMNAVFGIVAMTLLCARRLATYFSGWLGLSYEDERYAYIRRKFPTSGVAHYTFSFMVWHVLTTAMFFAAIVPVFYILTTPYYHHSWLLILGFVISCLCIITDAWFFWVGVYLMAVGVSFTLWWTFFAPICVFFVMLFTGYSHYELRFIPFRPIFSM